MIDRTPSDCAFLRLWLHVDHMSEARVDMYRYPTITAARVEAKKICHAHVAYKVAIYAYKADGSLWHTLPVSLVFGTSGGFRKAVTR